MHCIYSTCIYSTCVLPADTPPPSTAFDPSGGWGSYLGVGGAGGCPPEMLSLVDVISCILVNPGDGQLEMGNTLVSSDS